MLTQKSGKIAVPKSTKSGLQPQNTFNIGLSKIPNFKKSVSTKSKHYLASPKSTIYLQTDNSFTMRPKIPKSSRNLTESMKSGGNYRRMPNKQKKKLIFEVN